MSALPPPLDALFACSTKRLFAGFEIGVGVGHRDETATAPLMACNLVALQEPPITERLGICPPGALARGQVPRDNGGSLFPS